MPFVSLALSGEFSPALARGYGGLLLPLLFGVAWFHIFSSVTATRVVLSIVTIPSLALLVA
jgi:hypothetical protein